MDKYNCFLSIDLYIYCSSLFIFVFYPTLFISIIPICLYLSIPFNSCLQISMFFCPFQSVQINLNHAICKLNLFISIYTVSFITDFLQRTGIFFFRLSTLSPFILRSILINSLHICFVHISHIPFTSVSLICHSSLFYFLPFG